MAKSNEMAKPNAEFPSAWHKKAEQVQEIISRYPHERSAIMPLLHLAQQERGYLAPDDLEKVGELIGETRAYVESVASFYTLYRRKPHGRYTLTVCENLSCALCGGEELSRHLKERLGIEAGETTPDGLFTLEPTGECLAACDGAPAMQVNLEYHLGVTADKADALLSALRTEAAGANADRASAVQAATGDSAAKGGGAGGV